MTWPASPVEKVRKSPKRICIYVCSPLSRLWTSLCTITAGEPGTNRRSSKCHQPQREGLCASTLDFMILRRSKTTASSKQTSEQAKAVPIRRRPMRVLRRRYTNFAAQLRIHGLESHEYTVQPICGLTIGGARRALRFVVAPACDTAWGERWVFEALVRPVFLFTAPQHILPSQHRLPRLATDQQTIPPAEPIFNTTPPSTLS